MHAMDRMLSLHIGARTETARSSPSATQGSLSITKAHALLPGAAIPGKLPVHPTLPSATQAALRPATTTATHAVQQTVIANPRDPSTKIMRDSAPFFPLCEAVRSESKTGFLRQRAALEKAPDFDKHYDAYRRWRDCKPTDRTNPAYEKIAREGMAAQREIMRRSGVAGGDKGQLAALLAEKPELLRYVSPITGDFRAPKVGLMAGLRFTGAGVPTLAFPGTGSGVMFRSQWATNLRQFLGLGGAPKAHTLGAELARAIKEAVEEKQGKLVIIGHSLGGGIGSFVAAEVDRECYLYNPAALGRGSRSYLNEKHKEGLTALAKKQHIIRIKNDPVSSPAMQDRLATLIGRFDPLFETPCHLGNVHVIPREQVNPKLQGLLDLHTMRAFADFYEAREGSAGPA